MGELTADRLQGGRPYLGSGLFFASYRIRGKTQYKTYCAVLVCLTSKAVRIELVSELLTDAFGIASEVSSLDATNFSGAATKLAEFQTRFLSKVDISLICDYTTNKGFDFSFIPPRALHFGGPWEAAIKSAKMLAVKNMAQANLAFEELQTIFIYVEGMLNPRPISPASDDPNDTTAVTPAHLLIGTPIASVSEEHLYHSKDDHQKEAKYVERL